MITDLAFGEFLSNQNKLRIKEQEKLYHYYICQHDKIIKYLEKALEITFDADDIEEFQKNYINITKKVVNSLAVVYKDPAYRYFVSEAGDDKAKREKSNYYNSLLPMNINSKDKTSNRYAKLFNTSITQIGFNTETGKITYVNRPSHLYDVIWDENDCYKPLEVKYKQYMTIKGKIEEVVLVWDSQNHYGLDSFGNDFSIGNNKNMKNPFGTLPFAINREEEQDDFWGTGQTDLVNGNEQVNFLMTDLINGGVIMQAWGTPVATNLGLAKKTDKGDYAYRRVRSGPKHPITIEGVSSDMVTPTLSYENANPLIKEVMEVIDWQFVKIALSKGLDPNRIIGKLTDASGFAKIVDAIEQNELRRDSLEPCREYEEERFQITRKIVNYYADTTEGKKFNLKKIDEKDQLVVDFAEIEPPVDAETQILVDDFHLKRNVISVVDVAKRKNPDLTEKEIIDVLEKNKKINEKYSIDETAINNVDNLRKQRLSDKMLNNNKEV